MNVVLPSALPGIFTASLLGIGRVIGETAALLLTLGGSLLIPKSIFSPARTLSMHLYLVAMETGEFGVAFGTANSNPSFTCNVIISVLKLGAILS
jgi:phosphate transport system permease protein